MIKPEIRPETDEKTHIYTLIVRPDNTVSALFSAHGCGTWILYDTSLKYSVL